MVSSYFSAMQKKNFFNASANPEANKGAKATIANCKEYLTC